MSVKEEDWERMIALVAKERDLVEVVTTACLKKGKKLSFTRGFESVEREDV